MRVYRQGKTHAKFFSDSGYHGKEQALQRAIVYKMEYERQHPPLYPADAPCPPFRTKPQRNE